MFQALTLLPALLACPAPQAPDPPLVVWSMECTGDDAEIFAEGIADGDAFGSSLAGLGDLDGDGIPDLAVGAPGSGGSGVRRGAVYVLLLDSAGQPRFSRRIDDTGGILGGELDDFDGFGSSLAAPGDVDGDGITDLAVGVPLDDHGEDPLGNQGALWILFLGRDGEPRDAARITLGPEGPTDPLPPRSSFGTALATPGDVDGDGVPDLVVGAPGDEGAGGEGGAVYLLFLRRDGTVREARAIARGNETPETGSPLGGQRFGSALAFLGGPDERGFRRLAVGSPQAYLRGRRSGTVSILRLGPEGDVRHRAPLDAESGFDARLRSGDAFGASLASPGDYDGDGPDLVVGASGADAGLSRTDEGAVWLLRLDLRDQVHAYQRLAPGQDGLPGALERFDRYGTSVASPGDLDHNGLPDLAVGAMGAAAAGTHRGALWVVRFADCAPARSGYRPAAGRKSNRLTCSEPPRLGETWVVEIDCAGHEPAAFAFVASGVPARLPAGTRGTLLVLAKAPAILFRLTGRHEGDVVRVPIGIPDRAAFCGLTIFTQALVRGEPGGELTNALDAQVGR